jgi:hypothetical protein
MEEQPQGNLFPDLVQRVLSLTLTIVAALLYAAILGTALVRTIVEGNPEFSPGAVRAASLLSGLVGAVVTAGFARGRGQVSALPIITPRAAPRHVHPAWSSLKPASRARAKFMGLAALLGFPVELLRPSPSAASGEGEEGEPVTAAPEVMTVAAWVALLYFVVYFLVGVVALALAVLRSEVPDLILNAAWVWLGTVISAGYSFFALDA